MASGSDVRSQNSLNGVGYPVHARVPPNKTIAWHDEVTEYLRAREQIAPPKGNPVAFQSEGARTDVFASTTGCFDPYLARVLIPNRAFL